MTASPDSLADDTPAPGSGFASAAEQQAVDVVRDRLRARFPADRAYALADLSDPALPAPVARFIAQALQRRLVMEREALRRDPSPWFDHDAPAVDAAWEDLFDALSAHARVPASEWARALDHASGQVALYLLRPAPTLAAFVFSDGAPDLPVGVILRRMSYFTSYPYLRDVAAAYVEQRGLERLDRDTFGRLLARVERRTPTAYRGQWPALLGDLFATLAPPSAHPDAAALPARVLAPALADRGLTDLAARLAAHDGDLTLAQLARLIDEEPAAAPPRAPAPPPAPAPPAPAPPAPAPPAPFDAPMSADAETPVDALASDDAPPAGDDNPRVDAQPRYGAAHAFDIEPPVEAREMPAPPPVAEAYDADGEDETFEDAGSDAWHSHAPQSDASQSDAGPVWETAARPSAAAFDADAARPDADRRAVPGAGPDSDAGPLAARAPVGGADTGPIWTQATAPAASARDLATGPAAPAPDAPGQAASASRTVTAVPGDDGRPGVPSGAAWERFARRPDEATADDAGDERPLWQRFLRRERGAEVLPGESASLDRLEAAALGAAPHAQRPAFIATLFGGDEGDYADTLRRLDAARSWSDAAAVLLDAFRTQGVDLYDATAVAFTDAAEQRYLR